MAHEIEGIEGPVPEGQNPECDCSIAFVGFDSAWADNAKAPGAICAVSREGGKWIGFKPPEFASFEQASGFVQSLKNEHALTIVAIDQPTIVPNLTGGRPVDRVAARLIGWLGGGVVLASRSIKGMFDDDAPIRRFLIGIGCIQNPETARSPSSGWVAQGKTLRRWHRRVSLERFGERCSAPTGRPGDGGSPRVTCTPSKPSARRGAMRSSPSSPGQRVSGEGPRGRPGSDKL